MSYIKSQVDRGSTMLVRVEHGRHTNITAPTLYSGRRASVAFGAQRLALLRMKSSLGGSLLAT